MEPTVDVWLTDTSAWDGAAARRLLDADELARADRFLRPDSRRRFAVAHAALRRVLARHTGREPGVLRFVSRPCPHCGGPHGKPALAGPASPEFNLSHSGRLVAIAVAVAGRQVGIDVQEVTPVDHMALARRFFTPGEHDDIVARAEPGAGERFHQLWARKEAVLKATGEGITAGLGRVDVREDGDGRIAAARPPYGTITVRDVDVMASYRAAVAAPGDDWTMRTHTLAP